MLGVKQLRCLRGDKELFSNLTFSLAPGNCLEIEGHNGSGKSSLLKIVVGLLPASSGFIEWQNQKITFPNPTYYSDLLYIGHKTGVNGRLTPHENLNFWYALGNGDPLYKQEALKKACSLFDLEQYRSVPCEQLSQGYCQRVACARLSFSTATVWILDEPCTALDKEAISIFSSLVLQHLNRGGIVMMVSHTVLPLLHCSMGSSAFKKISLPQPVHYKGTVFN